MINLGSYSSEEKSQQPSVRGPVPEGSMVGVTVSVRDSQYGDAVEPYIVVARSGLRRLNLCFEVACGTYKGVRWTEGITLPKEYQTIDMTAGQSKSADIGARQLCSLWDASHGIRGGDTSQEANAKRNIKSWSDFTNLKCFVRVGVQDGKDGRKYNCLSGVVGVSSDNYAKLKEKLEIIEEPKEKPVQHVGSSPVVKTSLAELSEDIPF